MGEQITGSIMKNDLTPALDGTGLFRVTLDQDPSTRWQDKFSSFNPEQQYEMKLFGAGNGNPEVRFKCQSGQVQKAYRAAVAIIAETNKALAKEDEEAAARKKHESEQLEKIRTGFLEELARLREP